jgi:hypothetical protein
MQNFEITDYFVTCSLNQRTIFIKLVNKLSYICYEANLDAKEFRLPFDIEQIYKLIAKCFKQQEETDFKIEINSTNALKILFTVKIIIDSSSPDNFLTINFETLLREKLMSNDAQLSINYHRIEQKQANDIRILTERISQLEEWVEVISNAEICLFNNGSGTCVFYAVNITELTLNANLNYNWNKIQYFVRLQKMEIHNNHQISNLSSFKNKNIKVLSLTSMPPFNSFKGLSGFPELRILTVTSCASVSDLVFVLSSYEHCIQNINVTSCGMINNTELMTYCQKNNIKLALK